MSPRSRAAVVRRERGAAAVEFALVVPVLVLLLLGIVEFGRVMQVQSTLSAAAREGVRVTALGGTVAEARSAARTAATGLGLTDAQIAVSPAACSTGDAGSTVRVIISYRQTFVSGALGRTGADLTGRAVMRCGA